MTLQAPPQQPLAQREESEDGRRFGRSVTSSANAAAAFCSLGAGLQLLLVEAPGAPNAALGTVYLLAAPIWVILALVGRTERWRMAGRGLFCGGAAIQAVFTAVSPEDLLLVGELSFVLFVMLVAVVERERRVIPLTCLLISGFAAALGIRHYLAPTRLFLPASEVFFGLLVPVIILALVSGIASLLIRQLKSSLRESEGGRRELGHLAAELENRNAALTNFNRAAAHDLRSPLGAIGKLSRWLRDELESERGALGEDSAEMFELIRAQVRRMEAILDGLMAYARSGLSDVSRRRVDTGELLRAVVEALDVPPGFVVRLGPELPTLETQASFLEQALGNLIGNAIQHHDRSEGTIEVHVEQEPGAVVFVITDDGPGVPPEFRAQIFEPFQRLRSKDEVEGSGLGLAITRQLAEAVGGAITVEAAAPRGSSFRLRWPLAPPPDAAG